MVRRDPPVTGVLVMRCVFPLVFVLFCGMGPAKWGRASSGFLARYFLSVG